MAVEEHIWIPSKSLGGVTKKSSAPRLDQRQSGERPFQKRVRKESEMAGWLALSSCALLPAFSALKEMGFLIHNYSQTFRTITKYAIYELSCSKININKVKLIKLQCKNMKISINLDIIS